MRLAPPARLPSAVRKPLPSMLSPAAAMAVPLALYQLSGSSAAAGVPPPPATLVSWSEMVPAAW